MKTKCFIFDLDGTLVDTENIHARIESEMLSEIGVSISPEDISKKYAGVPTESYIGRLGKFKLDPRKFVIEKEKKLKKYVRISGIDPVGGMPELVEFLHNKKFPLFIVSSSSSAWIESCLNCPIDINGKKFFFGKFFKDGYISCQDEQIEKENPETFKKAKRVIENSLDVGCDDVEFVGIGDGMADMNGALNAGMKSLLISTEHVPKRQNLKQFQNSSDLIEYVRRYVGS